MNYLIIGSSAASLACAVQLKRLQPDAKLVLLTKQREKPNNTCLMADYIAGRRQLQSLYLPFGQLPIIYNAEVAAIDATARTITTHAGEIYTYQKLFIGTGLQPITPPVFVPYLGSNVFLFKTLDDITEFVKLESSLTGRRALVVGGGVTGVEASEALALRGYSVTLCEKSERLLPRSAVDVSREVHEILERNGVCVMCNFVAQQELMHDFDVTFLATGGVPATHFVRDQLKLHNGYICVDGAQQTSDADIFAGGDVVGNTLWRQALADGRRAAYAMAGTVSLDTIFGHSGRAALGASGDSTQTQIFGKLFTVTY